MINKIKTIAFLLLIFSFLSFFLISCENPTTSEPQIIPPQESVYYTVVFNSDGGSTVESQKIEKGKNATKPDNPTKEGYTFSDWYNESSIFDFSTPIEKNITLIAHWSKTSESSSDNNSDTKINDSDDDSSLNPSNNDNTNSDSIIYDLNDESNINIDTSETDVYVKYIFNKNDGTDNTIEKVFYQKITKYYRSDNGRISFSFMFPDAEDISFSREGYVLAGWGTSSDYYERNNDISYHIHGQKISMSLAVGKTNWTENLYAIWLPVGTKATYKVRHLLQNIEDDYYRDVTEDTEYLTGNVGEYTAAIPKNYGSMYVPVFTQILLSAGDDNFIDIHYNLKTITLTFEIENESFKRTDLKKWDDDSSGRKTIIGKYGTTINENLIPKLKQQDSSSINLTGYGTGYSEEIPQTFTEDKTYKAYHIVPYKIYHRPRPKTGTIGDETEIFYGKHGEQTNAIPKEYEGLFLYTQFSQRILEADYPFIFYFDWYYYPSEIFITLQPNGGIWENNCSDEIILTGKWGDAVEYPSITKKGYEFKGWKTANGVQAGTQFNHDYTYIAQWQ